MKAESNFTTTDIFPEHFALDNDKPPVATAEGTPILERHKIPPLLTSTTYPKVNAFLPSTLFSV